MSTDIREDKEKAEAKEAIKNGTATEQQEDKVDYAICPCCGKPTLVKPIQVKGPLLDHYISCIVSGVPFSHTYPIYEDKIQVTVTQLDKAMALKIAGASAVLSAAENKFPASKKQLEDFESMLKLYCSISSIHMQNGGQDKTLTPSELVSDICGKLTALAASVETGAEAALKELTTLYEMLTNPAYVSGLPGIMLGSVISTHNEVYNILMNVGFGPNFWKGIELG